MSSTLTRALFMACGGFFLAALVVGLARRGLLTLRYTLGWLGLAVIGLSALLLAPLVKPLAEAFNLTGTGLILAAATSVLLVICLQLSVTVSGLLARSRELAETSALLEARLAERVGDPPGSPGP